MVICLSELLLASPEHVHEAEAAVAAGVHVVAVVPEGSRWADAAGHKVCGCKHTPWSGLSSGSQARGT